MLVRTDDNGVRVMVRADLSEEEAAALVREMTARGHKQTFEALPYEPGCQDDVIERFAVVR